MKTRNHSNAFQPVRSGLALGLFLLTTIAFSSSATGRASNNVPTGPISQTGAEAQAGRGSSSAAFITIEGPTLEARLRSAIKEGRSTYSGKPFWAAYSFPVRLGVMVDGGYCDNCVNCVGGTVESRAATQGIDRETKNVGIFFLYSAGGNAIDRARVYNLDRHHDFGGRPVLWMGKADPEQSVGLLRDLIDSKQSDELSKACVMALGLHEAVQAGQSLKDLTAARYSESVRSAAVFWVGRFPGAVPFLDAFARESSNGLELRKQAVFSIASGEDESALPTLESLFDTVASAELKKQIVFGASINRQAEPGLSFLIKLAQAEPDREIRKTAIFWLGQKAGERSLKALGDVINGTDEDTEVQKQAVFALSQRPKDEAIPILIRIAKTHQNAAVRKQAIFWLGQTGDERAVDLFEEILQK
jgi:HEAT repeat protein